MIKPNRFAVAITGLLLSATIASAQGTLTEADIINSLVETGPAMQAAGFDVAAIQKALFERIGAVRQRMLADWAAEGPSYGVDKPMEMLEFFEQRYKAHAGK